VKAEKAVGVLIQQRSGPMTPVCDLMAMEWSARCPSDACVSRIVQLGNDVVSLSLVDCELQPIDLQTLGTGFTARSAGRLIANNVASDLSLLA